MLENNEDLSHCLIIAMPKKKLWIDQKHNRNKFFKICKLNKRYDK